MSAVDIFCTILDVCLAKTESNVYFIQVNSEFVYGDTRYNAGDVLDVRNKENFTGNKMSGLWVRNVSESSERYLPSSVKGLFSIRNDLNIGKPVGVKYKRSVPLPPVLNQTMMRKGRLLNKSLAAIISTTTTTTTTIPIKITKLEQ